MNFHFSFCIHNAAVVGVNHALHMCTMTSRRARHNLLGDWGCFDCIRFVLLLMLKKVLNEMLCSFDTKFHSFVFSFVCVCLFVFINIWILLTRISC